MVHSRMNRLSVYYTIVTINFHIGNILRSSNATAMYIRGVIFIFGGFIVGETDSPRVDEMIGSCTDVASLFDKESNPLHRILPFNRKSTHVTDELFS